MEVKNHENKNITLNLRLSQVQYERFLKDIKQLGQKAEANSDVEKLDYFVSSHFQKLPQVAVGGICSRVIEDSGQILEVVFLDVDNQMRFLFESECRFLMDEYNLSPFYIFSTFEQLDPISKKPFGNYHGISITKCPYKKILEMQSKVHTLDPAYSVIPKIFRWKTWVLRATNKKNRPKPNFVGMVGNLDVIYPQDCSNAHRLFIEGVYKNVPKIKYGNLDKHGVEDIFLTEYKTSANVGK